jgi:hypothetical protein
MRRCISIVFAAILFSLIFGFNVYADLVSDGRVLLFNHGNPTYSGILVANQKFEDALSLDSNNQQANLFYAVTRMAAFALESGNGGGLETLRDVFEAFGMTRNSNDFLDVGPPYDTSSGLPGNSPSGEAIRQFLAGPYMNLLNETLENLEQISSSFNTILTADETGDQAVEVDYGDVLMYKAMINANRCLVLIMSSYNLNVDIDAVANKISNDQFNINPDLLKPYPDLLKLLTGGGGALINAETALIETIDSYLAASAFIRSETDYQWDDLIEMIPEDAEDEALFRQNLNEFKASLNQSRTADLTDNENNLSLNLNPFFGAGSGPYSLRDFLPQFNQCDDPINGSMGHGLGDDPTLGGMLPEFSQADWNFELNRCIMSMPWIPLLLLDE